MDKIKLLAWCAAEGVAPPRAFWVGNLPENITTQKLLEVLRANDDLGRVKCLGRYYNLNDDQWFALCCSDKDLVEVDLTETMDTDSDSPPLTLQQVLLMPDPQTPTPDFKKKLQMFLETEGKTLNDLQEVAGVQAASSTSATDDLLSTIGKALEKALKPSSEGTSYKRLRVFSGVKPTPSQEDDYDTWMDQAAHMIQEWQCGEGEKRKRLVESLRGPALDVVRPLRVANPDASAQEYLSTLEHMFGSTESGEDLYLRFRTTMQKQGEKLSIFLARLEKLLQKVYVKGGIEASALGKARLNQLLKGAIYSDMCLVKLRLKERQKNPPTFSVLIKEIREEEERESLKQNPPTAPIRVHHANTPDVTPAPNAEMDSLKEQLQEIRKQISSLTVQQQHHYQDARPRQDVRARGHQPFYKRENSAEGTGQDGTTLHSAGRQPLPTTIRAPFRSFCYRCGLDGHRIKECVNTGNATLVAERLEAMYGNQLGNYDGTQ
ncbi:paraneoplastic antigen Ma1 homolog isoform X1 [Acipenser ruthenus]|uniref:paraneoplastic antigen Ma1 homolog isoform X1 n=2 Tax=Acipenser ruthenus TaxID=7906 RepID=UPI0027408265|nr:paraneoplastic antigen Ma1 homolog isoform X1 [Acipenser ruthenus]